MPRVKTTPAPVADLPFPVADPVVETDADRTADAPQTPTAPLSDSTAELVATRWRLEQAADELLAKMANGVVLSAGERQLLKSVAPPNATTSGNGFQKWLSAEASRIKSIRELQATSGTRAERQRAEADLDAARQRQAAESPGLREQIARLQGELSALAHAVDVAARDIQRREQAAEALQAHRLLPSRIQEQIKVVKHLNEHDRQAFLHAESRSKIIAGLLAYDPAIAAGRAAILQYLEGPLRTPDGRRLQDVVAPFHEPYNRHQDNPRDIQAGEWAKHCDVLRAELADCAATIQRLEPINHRVAEEIRQLRQYLVPK
ncbi:MAG: hypothetical protein GXY83_43135 [Rhodopirellula sp.]|nr:hypothetical protein [Rhodopirellula sp.]